MEGHVISATGGCCHTKNQGLIFEYERPGYYGAGMECCKTPPIPCCPDGGGGGGGGGGAFDSGGTTPPVVPPTVITDPEPCEGPPCSSIPPYVKKCCGTGKEGTTNVRFYYNYIGQYFNIDFNCTGKYSKWPNNGLPRLCSWCDPTSLEANWGDNPALGFGQETCMDYLPRNPAQDTRIDDSWPPEPNSLTVYPCSTYGGATDLGLNLFNGCQCMGYGDLKDPAKTQNATTFSAKRLSRYRKRQMEANPQHRWLLDIMCYDKGNVVASPYYQYRLVGGQGDDEVVAEVDEIENGGTLYNHLIGVVHCEHWYEIARCPDNPEHDDPNGVLGGWITDSEGNVVGANTSNIAPRFWIYACSGVPIFDFEIERATKTFDEFGMPFIDGDDYKHIVEQFAQKRTPKQDVMNKLAKAGLFDLGDWRQTALNEITVLQGLSLTSEYYGPIQGYSGDEGACCFGASGDMNSSCVFMKGVSCGLCGGDFFLGRRCTSDLCVSCSGFKPHLVTNPFSKYLGPVRKKLYIPFNPAEGQGGIDFNGITRPAFLDPRKARPNRWPDDSDSFEKIPSLAEGKERDFNSASGQDPTLIDLQLPRDLLPMPWGDFTDPNFFSNGGTLPAPPLPGQAPSDEYTQFKTWLDTQWLYLHARPGGWDYVCAGYQGDGVELNPDGSVANPIDQTPRIPNIRRKYSNNCAGVGCCLDGVKGWPQRTFEFSGGCPVDINCGYIDEDGVQRQAPIVGCDSPYGEGCAGLECVDSSWCADHPDQGGGQAPCRSLAFSSSCEGMRFTYYRHRQVNGDDINPNDYTTCNGSVRSWLYRVNIDSGNYGGFCPHSCRTLSVPKRIVDSLPVVFSNRLAAHSLCSQLLQNDSRGTMCDGLYCFSDPVVIIGEGGIPIPPFYGVGLGTQSHCCGGKRESSPVNGPIPTDSTHPASNRANCPLYPGPGCSTPTCRLYDGKFVGQYINLNPRGCCWKCQLGVNGIITPESYQGVEDLFECEDLQPDNVREFDGYQYVGRGFIPLDQIGGVVGCGTTWAGNCACGTNNAPSFLPPLSSGEYCQPPDLGDEDIPTGDKNY